MSLLQQTIDIITFHWPEIVAFVTATGLLGFSIQKLKRWLSLNSDRTIYALTMAVGLIAAVVQALLTNSNLTLKVIGSHGAYILSTLQVLFVYVIKPATKLLKDAEAQREGILSASVTKTQVVTPTTATTTISGTVNDAPITATTTAHPVEFDS